MSFCAIIYENTKPILNYNRLNLLKKKQMLKTVINMFEKNVPIATKERFLKKDCCILVF